MSALAALFPGGLSADPAKNIQAAARVLTFLENPPAGRTEIGVVFDPAKPASVAEKNAIMIAIGGGYTTGGITIVGKPMEAGAVGGAKVLFVTHGVNYAAAGSDARAQRAITIGSDFACVQSGACVIAISTDPTVQIVVNHKAAAAVGASFRAAFRMMIQEI
ncbi:MAG TPA: hypothetical protein VL358_15045 [Caulobacteraceae bacterium]|jgi:hypothetical protein|nr:hypothetical protein [Caulobacteraceae bacterium]